MMVLTTEQMKRAEGLTDKAGLSYHEMMLNAGIKASEFINMQYEIAGKMCVILCGCGNNAGDGFVVAKRICEVCSEVCVVMCNGEVKSGVALEMQRLIESTRVKILTLGKDDDEICLKLASATVVVDAVFGTGFKGELNPQQAILFKFVNDIDGARVALDMPSGINADTGECAPNHLAADVTLAFSAMKPAHQVEESKLFCGKIFVLDIGIPNDISFIVKNDIKLITQKMINSIIPKRNQRTHKGNYGRLLNVAGSSGMCGAAMMSTLAAMRTGTGLTTLASTGFVTGVVAPHIMEATTISLDENDVGGMSGESCEKIAKVLSKSTACLVGCGMDSTFDTKKIVEYIIDTTDCSLILDADALNVISSDLTILNRLTVETVITPHLGEMARLASLTIDQVQKNIMETARLFASEHNVVVVLKTHRTIIASPDGEIYQNTTGNAGLAKGGSGDVLAGIIAAFAAQGMDVKNAAICGVFVHGLAADLLEQRMSQYSMLARDVIEEIPFALKSLDR